MAGPLDSKDLGLLTGYDATELEKHRTQDGVSFLEIAQEIQIALNAADRAIFSDPVVSGLVNFTDEPTVEYESGNNSGFERFTEYSQPDADMGDVEGHMLPLMAWDKKLGFTWTYLKNASSSRVRTRIASSIRDYQKNVRQRILTRVLQRGDDSGSSKGLGASGFSPGFATAAANTSVDFTPPNVVGIAHDSDHEHYVAVAGGWTTGILDDMESELSEHGHAGDYNLLVGMSDEATIEGLTGFIKVGNSLVNFGNNTSIATGGNAPTPIGARLIGVYGNMRVWTMPGMPQHYGFAYQSYGSNDPRNPLRIRLEKGATLPSVTAMRDPRSGTGAYALQDLILYTEYGVGVGDRTNGTTRYVNNATWADGTAT